MAQISVRRLKCSCLRLTDLFGGGAMWISNSCAWFHGLLSKSWLMSRVIQSRACSVTHVAIVVAPTTQRVFYFSPLFGDDLIKHQSWVYIAEQVICNVFRLKTFCQQLINFQIERFSDRVLDATPLTASRISRAATLRAA